MVWSLIKVRGPDVILLDLMMPEMTGDKMLAQMRKTDWGNDIKVIVMTNVSHDEALPKVKDLRVDRFIVNENINPH
ncbi:MAG: response regulator [Patescibacteria group bacterium]